MNPKELGLQSEEQESEPILTEIFQSEILRLGLPIDASSSAILEKLKFERDNTNKGRLTSKDLPRIYLDAHFPETFTETLEQKEAKKPVIEQIINLVGWRLGLETPSAPKVLELIHYKAELDKKRPIAP